MDCPRAFFQRVMTDTNIIANTPEAKHGSVTLTFGWDETKQKFQKTQTFVEPITVGHGNVAADDDADANVDADAADQYFACIFPSKSIWIFHWYCGLTMCFK